MQGSVRIGRASIQHFSKVTWVVQKLENESTLRGAGLVGLARLIDCRSTNAAKVQVLASSSSPCLSSSVLASQAESIGLFSVLPELICYRHGHPPVRPVPISSCAPWQWASGQNCSPRLPVRSKTNHCKILKSVTARPAAAFRKLLKFAAARRGGCENLRGKARQRDTGPVLIFGSEIAI